METITHATPQLTVTGAQRSVDAVPRAAGEVSLFRLYVLRATYLLIVVGLGSTVWPLLLDSTRRWSHMHGAALVLLAGVTVLAALGIRYPLRMLPLLMFELVWKSMWLLAIALPRWQGGDMDAATMKGLFEIGSGLVIFPLAIPWGYVWTNFVKASGDRWK